MSQYHKNTAPFLSVRLAQRFGLSNPSPRFVKAMATAFTTGSYQDASSGIQFGSNKYGDLGALLAALLLDRESRSVVLDADPTHGSLFEPFLKYVRLLRSLELTMKEDYVFPRFHVDVQNLIGQEAHQLTDVLIIGVQVLLC